jgi:hypothetical protein
MGNMNEILQRLEPSESYVFKPKPASPIVRSSDTSVWDLPTYSMLKHNPPAPLRPGADDNKKILSRGF